MRFCQHGFSTLLADGSGHVLCKNTIRKRAARPSWLLDRFADGKLYEIPVLSQIFNVGQFLAVYRGQVLAHSLNCTFQVTRPLREINSERCEEQIRMPVR